MQYLIVVDLEGVHGVVGEPFCTLSDCADYEKAIRAATLEVNTAIEALFDGGAEKVLVWDNHGKGANLDFEKIDARAVRVDTTGNASRFDFVLPHKIDHILFFGYHAKEGTPRGVLAHTYSSVSIQYVKLNGVAVGELAVDSAICATHGISPLFIAADDMAIAEMRDVCPDITAVITKYGKGRNQADLRESADVLAEIYKGVREAMVAKRAAFSYNFPVPSVLEVRYTRAEKAAAKYEAWRDKLPVRYGEDTHVLFFEIDTPKLIPKLL